MASRRPLLNKKAVAAALAALCALSNTGCAPTYPKEIVDEAIAQLCREEYDLDVKVKIMGSTVGVYLPIEGLFDAKLSLAEGSIKKINDVILSVSRVTLSTDATLDFYIVIAQDPFLPEIEVVLIRYVNDIRMLHFEQISRGESAKRMLTDIKLTPQAQKEKVLRDIFGRLNIKEAEELVAEYLNTSEVSGIGDIGYWNGSFFIKDIDMGEFLALQIAERSKARLTEDAVLGGTFKLNSVTGRFLDEAGKSYFRFTFDAAYATDAQDEITPVLGGRERWEAAPEADADAICAAILDVASNVLRGYRFKDFWNIEIVDAGDDQVLFATGEELEEYRKKKIKLEEFRRWYR